MCKIHNLINKNKINLVLKKQIFQIDLFFIFLNITINIVRVLSFWVKIYNSNVRYYSYTFKDISKNNNYNI
ncbi:hypothetical protein NUSPORA_01035 [Nucleospora cyclopteri]